VQDCIRAPLWGVLFCIRAIVFLSSHVSVYTCRCPVSAYTNVLGKARRELTDVVSAAFQAWSDSCRCRRSVEVAGGVAGAPHAAAHLTLQGSERNWEARHSLGCSLHFLPTLWMWTGRAGGLVCAVSAQSCLRGGRRPGCEQLPACLRRLWHKQTWSSAVPWVKFRSVAHFLIWMDLAKGEEKLKKTKP